MTTAGRGGDSVPRHHPARKAPQRPLKSQLRQLHRNQQGKIQYN